jgi:hypothetical protein
MTGFNFLSHGSQDLLVVFLEKNKLFPAPLASKVAIISNCGAVAGGIIAGYCSQYTGRRLAIVIMLIWTGCFIPLWILPSTFGKSESRGFGDSWLSRNSAGLTCSFASIFSQRRGVLPSVRCTGSLGEFELASPRPRIIDR